MGKRGVRAACKSMDISSQLDELADILGRLGVPFRKEHLGGRGGGLCRLRGQSVVFLDLDADPATRLDSCLRALAALPEAERAYLPPHVREGIDRVSRTS